MSRNLHIFVDSAHVLRKCRSGAAEMAALRHAAMPFATNHLQLKSRSRSTCQIQVQECLFLAPFHRRFRRCNLGVPTRRDYSSLHRHGIPTSCVILPGRNRLQSNGPPTPSRASADPTDPCAAADSLSLCAVQCLAPPAAHDL